MLFLVYAIFMAYVSLRSMSGIELEHSDKFFHFIAYGLFAVLGFRTVSGRKAYMYLCLGIVVYGGLMEVAQSFTPRRMMSVYDFIANTIGVFIGVISAQKIYSYIGIKSNNGYTNGN